VSTTTVGFGIGAGPTDERVGTKFGIRGCSCTCRRGNRGREWSLESVTNESSIQSMTSRKRLGKQIGNIVGRLEDGSKRRQECHGEIICLVYSKEWNKPRDANNRQSKCQSEEDRQSEEGLTTGADDMEGT